MEFFEKLQRVCGQVPSGSPVHPILSSPAPVRLTVGNWSLTSQKEGEITIHNADGTKVSACKSVVVLSYICVCVCPASSLPAILPTLC